MFLLRLSLVVFSLCVCRSSFAWVEYGVSAGSGFHYLSSTSASGSNLKLTGRPAPEFRPFASVILNQDDDQLNFFLSGRQYNYEPPSGTSNMIHRGHYFLGGGFDYSSDSFLGHYHLGLDLFQRPMGLQIDSQTILLKKVLALSVPIELSTPLVVLEKQLVRAGAYGAVSFPWLENAVSGYRAGAFVDIERRGFARYTLRGYYEVRAMELAAVHQDEVEIGVCLKVGFSGGHELGPTLEAVE
jgi:hypothetical protein